MPRWPSFKPSIEDCLIINISKLREWGYLKNGWDFYHRSYMWYQGDRKTASIGFTIECVNEDLKCMTLKYKQRETSVEYTVDIVAIPTNLGNGKRWYFVCPNTGKRCMKLISPNGQKYFLHRTAFNVLYEKQKESKSFRSIGKQFGYAFKLEKLYDELYSGNRKTHYKGEPTPLVRKILKMEKEWENNKVNYDKLFKSFL